MLQSNNTFLAACIFIYNCILGICPKRIRWCWFETFWFPIPILVVSSVCLFMSVWLDFSVRYFCLNFQHKNKFSINTNGQKTNEYSKHTNLINKNRIAKTKQNKKKRKISQILNKLATISSFNLINKNKWKKKH